MSVARIVALAVSATTTAVAIWTALECSIGLIVACCPALRVLLRRPGDRSTGHHSSAESVHVQQRPPGKQSRRLSKRVSGRETEGRMLVLGPHDRRIYKAVDFEIASDVASESSRQPMRGGNRVSGTRVESWVEL
jgi:hypothetical protein